MKSIGVVVFLLLMTFSTIANMQKDNARASDLQERILLTLQSYINNGVEGSFLIFEDQKIEKFIQFSFDKDELIFDLPMKALSPPEQSRAVSLLAQYGFPLQSVPAFDKPGGVIVDEWTGWNVALPGGARQGAEIGSRVFREVFQLTGEIELSIEYGK